MENNFNGSGNAIPRIPRHAKRKGKSLTVDKESSVDRTAKFNSNRKDPLCTGSSKAQPLFVHSGGDSGSHTENLQAGSECPFPENAIKIPRPRYNHKEKGNPRKRRHFYEVKYTGQDAGWFLNKRIKVFRPSDGRWYKGLVSDYDEERQLHCVHYADKDKAWINLKIVPFMLLVLRSEVTDVEKPLHLGADDKLIDKSGNYLTTSETDAEMIMALLALSSSAATSCSGVEAHETDTEIIMALLALSSSAATSCSAVKAKKRVTPNVLLTSADRCWREFGAEVATELADQNEWRLSVKFSGSTKYSHKVDHVFQPGLTNRYTRAMMWKGGKDWALEFPDRSQWILFKEMCKECYNRNICAASVKNIPIPGVRLVEKCEITTEKLPFTRLPRYLRQIENDIDMAMNPSKVFYDMDSEDEQWILRNENSFQTQETSGRVITDELFEKTMDTLEKVAYAQRRDHFTVAELENLMVGIVPSEVINAIYQHWQQKRKKTGCPLIRHLQPPSWERYQQKMQEWNQLMTKANTAAACVGKVRKPPPVEKPAMLAFCLKPRGLEAPNKGSKHRSHEKIHATHALIGDQYGVHTFGRRSNSFAVRDKKATYPDYSPENSNTSPSTKIYSPSDVCSHEYFSLNNDTSDFDNHPKLYKNKSKKIGALMPRSNLHALPLYNHRTPGKRNGVQQRDIELPDRPIQMHYQSEVYPRPGNMQLGVRDLDEFGVREAKSAAKRASIIAMLKRETAQRLLYRADLAINVAASAIMTADALKVSYCPNEDKNASSSE